MYEKHLGNKGYKVFNKQYSLLWLLKRKALNKLHWSNIHWGSSVAPVGEGMHWDIGALDELGPAIKC